MKQSIQKGFTLIELMIVVAIIGILASVALPAYREYIINSQMSSAFASTSVVQKAIATNYSRLGENWITPGAANAIGACAYNPVSGANNCWTTGLGMRAAPNADNIEGVSSVDTVAGTDPTAVANTCVGFGLANPPGTVGAPITPSIQYQITFDGNIDPDVAGTVTLIPVVDTTRPQTISWVATTGGTLNAAADLAGVACKWIHENINSDWI